MLANDLEGVNYSSIRAGLFDERENYKSVQTWFIESFVEPVFEAWLESAMLANVFPFGVSRFEKMNSPQWKPRRWPWVDPLKDQQASILAVENGLDSRQNIIAQTGGDIEDVFDSISADKILAESKGLSFEGENKSKEPVETEDETETIPPNE
jgi:lambda family phage portal protein